MARKGLQLASMAMPVLTSLGNKEAQVSALQCVSQLSLIPQAGEGHSPILFLLRLPFGKPDNQTPTRHRLKTTPCSHAGQGGCCFCRWGQLGHGLGLASPAPLRLGLSSGLLGAALVWLS